MFLHETAAAVVTAILGAAKPVSAELGHVLTILLTARESPLTTPADGASMKFIPPLLQSSVAETGPQGLFAEVS